MLESLKPASSGVEALQHPLASLGGEEPTWRQCGLATLGGSCLPSGKPCWESKPLEQALQT
jgi:hypothetical protein